MLGDGALKLQSISNRIDISQMFDATVVDALATL
jgi:hypothetical protein